MITNHGGEALFSARGIHVPVTTIPTLYRVDEYGDDLILCFTHLGQERRYLDNFEIVKRRPQVVDFVLVHFTPFAVQVRASQQNMRKFLDAVSRLVGGQPETVDWLPMTRLSEAQIYLLGKKLGARLGGSKHKMVEGAYATKEVTRASNVSDLAKRPEYKREFAGTPLVHSTWEFDFAYSFLNTPMRVSYSISKDGGIRFYTQVGEEVIRHVVQQIFLVQVDEATANSEELLISMLANEEPIEAAPP